MELASQAIEERIAAPLGLSLLAAAAGIVRVVDANMVGAIREQSLTRGVDPRDHVLVVGGGAGGSHACGLARHLGIRRVFVPKEAGTFCSFGMTVTDVRHDFARAHHALSSKMDLAALDAVFRGLEQTAGARLRAEGFTDDQVELRRYADARYPGQVHELTVAIQSEPSYDQASVVDIEDHFHDEHERHFAYARRDLPVEFLHWRVSAIGSNGLATPHHEMPPVGDARSAVIGQRDVYFPTVSELLPTDIYLAEKLVPGAEFTGPAVVQATTTTLVVNPGDQVAVLPDGGYELTIGIQPDSTASRRRANVVTGTAS